MDLVIDERDSNVSSSKSGDDDDQEDDQSSPHPTPSGFPPPGPLSTSRSSSYNQHSPDGSTTPSYNMPHQVKTVRLFTFIFLLHGIESMLVFSIWCLFSR